MGIAHLPAFSGRTLGFRKDQSMDKSSVGVLGAGLMGAGIAEVTARGGYNVLLVDVSGKALEKAKGPHQGQSGQVGGKGAASGS